MVYSVDDCILIENLYKFKSYGAKKLIREFPGKGWTVSGLNKLLRKLRNTVRRQGSGRPHSARTDNNVDSVNELILILNTMHEYKIWNVYFVANFLCYNTDKYF